VVTAPARTVEVRLSLAADPAEQGLRPGSSGRIEWQDARGHVPASLIVQREGRLGLFMVEGETARFHHLPDAQEGRASRVDLPPQQTVVVSGQAGLQDGQRVQVQAP